MGYGVVGTGIAGIITNSTVFVINFSACFFIEEIKPALMWPGWYVCDGLKRYLEIGIPSALMIMLDGCAWHLMSFTTGYLGVTSQASQIVCMQVVIIFY